MTVSLPSPLPASLPSDPQALSQILGNTDGLSVWPRSTRPEADEDISVSGVSLTEAADRFGTPSTYWTNKRSATAAVPTAPRSPKPTSSTPPRHSCAARSRTGCKKKAWAWTSAPQANSRSPSPPASHPRRS